MVYRCKGIVANIWETCKQANKSPLELKCDEDSGIESLGHEIVHEAFQKMLLHPTTIFTSMRLPSYLIIGDILAEISCASSIQDTTGAGGALA